MEHPDVEIYYNVSEIEEQSEEPSAESSNVVESVLPAGALARTPAPVGATDFIARHHVGSRYVGPRIRARLLP